MLEESFRLTRSLVQEIAVPAVREGDLPFVIKCVTQQVQEKFGLEVKLTVDEMMPPVSKNVYLCLYRAIQELLFNSIKHAHVQQVDVSVRKADGQSVQVIVKDKGPGFLMNKLDETGQAGTGFGLYNIRERVEGLGGSMEIVSGEGQGTTVILIVPVQDASV
jgi:signal transduction histidine kinase